MRSEPIQISLIFLQIFSWNIEIKCQESPCPRLFIYEPTGRENDKWYGVVTLISDSYMNGVWVRLIFDRPLLRLEFSQNWFEEVLVANNREYIVKNENRNLTANTLYPLRFHVKYDPSQPSPRLVGFQLNSQIVCPEELNTAVALPELFTSKQVQQQTSAPINDSSLNTPESEEEHYSLDANSTTAPVEDFECGTVAVLPRPLISYGQKTQAGEFPWHAALYLSRGVGLTYICGGSLLSKYHVVTVAHCVFRSKSHSPLYPENLLIYLGKYYLKRWSNPGVQDHQVARIIGHPKFDYRTYSNNIAVIKLAKPAQFTDFVRPICLWEGPGDFNHLTGKHGAVVGWGYDENGQLTEELNMLMMPVVGKETCIFSYPDFFSKFTTSETFCAGYRNGTSICNGDSGGGMVFAKDTATVGKKAYQLRGLVSVSVALQNDFKCDTSHYTVFVDVAMHLEFIREAMKQ